jgi:hypothetical protein
MKRTSHDLVITAIKALTLAALLSLAPLAVAQRSPARCTLERAPTVRGLSLGMPLGDYLKMFPRTARRGLETYDPNIGQEFVGVDSTERADFAGVRINTAAFVDGRLAFLSFAYPDFTPASTADFIRQAAARLGLPSRGWRAEGAAMRHLNCAGFIVTISTGNYGRRQEHPFLVLEDAAARAKVAERTRRQKSRARGREVFRP